MNPSGINRALLNRRRFLAAVGSLTLAGAPGCSTPLRLGGSLRLATFSCDVTPPLGHPLMGGGIAPASAVSDPLHARGLVLLGAGSPIVIVSIEWCEIRNEAYERWRKALARAAGTDKVRVLVTSVHVHDAPIADLGAERILKEAGAAGSVCDLEFHEGAVQRAGEALRRALPNAVRVTRIGMGQARVERVASNRRYESREGRPAFDRMSTTRDAHAREAPEGLIDPYLKTLSFWDEGKALAAVHGYATHPMSQYGRGNVSSDFVGLALRKFAAQTPGAQQIYVSGCSGNVTAGKFNDGADANRELLAEGIHHAMQNAWETTRTAPLREVRFRSTPLRFEPRESDGFGEAELRRRLETDPKPFGQCLAALGLSWRKRTETGLPIDLPLVDFGPAQLVLLPGEAYVEYQLLAQQLRPESFVMAMGYGECATGYIPVQQHWRENDTNLNDWCWVTPGSEQVLRSGLAKILSREYPVAGEGGGRRVGADGSVRSSLPARSGPGPLFDRLQLLELGLGAVMFVERIAAADEPVPRGRCAIAKGATDEFRVHGLPGHDIRQRGWVRQDHPAETDHVRPPLLENGLRHMRQILLQIAVGGADHQRSGPRPSAPVEMRLHLADDLDLACHPDKRVFRRLVPIARGIGRGPLDMRVVVR